ncbi:MAG: penicillin acylase family protein [Gammaproteobacteria bacterium]|nr:penicillin acylase family protein [Gammaproteobacteria bacterium]
MRRVIARTLAGALLAALILAVLVWLGMRASLPDIDGEATVAGIDADVVIERDDDGIPVITASSRADLAFATGYVHGQDRFFQMDLIRRRAAGELSALVGEAAVGIDKRFRFHRFRARAQRVYADSNDADRALIDAYAAGVNAGLASLDARPFEYVLLGSEPQAWQTEDSLIVVYAMYVTLNDARATKEVRRGLVQRVLPPEAYAWMYPQGTSWDAPLMGAAREVPPIPTADVYSVRHVADNAPPAEEHGRYPLRGSNNWAVAGSLTTNGRALVSNDMHLGHSAPNIWYQARLRVEGPQPIDVTGVGLPGTPFIVSGSNTRVAWGYTNSYGDWTDAVILQPGANEGTYRTPDGDLEFDVHAETIEVMDGEPVEYEIRETVWGPVLDDVDYPDGEIAVSWIAHKPEGLNLGLLRLESAASVAEALDIANTIAMPPQNFVAGDAAGNIGWTIAGAIPRKRGFDAMLPSDWSAAHGWQGWLEPHEYPRILNPDSGRIWTANARVTDGDALRLIGDGGYDLGARAQQIRDALFASDTFSPEDMLAIQYDDRALFLAPWRELLLGLLDEDAVRGDAELAEYRDLVFDWKPRAAPDSVGYRLVRAFRLEIKQRVFHALTAPAREVYGDKVTLRISNQFEGPLWSLVTERPMHMLPAGYQSWDEFMLAAVRENLAWFRGNYDGPLAERTWGERNTASIRHPLSGNVPLLGARLDMPEDRLNGDLDMPKAQGPTFGASQRYAVYPGDEANSILHMPTGQSGHPLSDFYDRGHDDWVDGRPNPFLPGAAAFTLTLRPDKR